MISVQPSNYWSILATVAMTTIYTIQAKMVDLSHDQGPDTLMAPGSPQYQLHPIYGGDIAPGVYARANSYSVGEHGGTHMDSPSHFSRSGLSLDQIPLEQTIADGVMVDCSMEVDEDPNYALTVQKIKEWEGKNGQIPQGAAVIVNFNWSHKFNNSSLYFNTQDLDNPNKYRFPIVSTEAAQWLTQHRDIQMLGTDTASADLWESTFPVHVEMLSRNKMLVENLKDPARLPARGFRFHASPIKFVGGTGGQVRAFAVIHTGTYPNGTGSCSLRHHSVSALVVLVLVDVVLVCLLSRF